MKLHHASLLTILTVTSLGCSNKDFTGSALSSHLSGPTPGDQCIPTSSKSVVSTFEITNKVMIDENTYGESGPMSVQDEPILKKGRELVVVVDEACVKQKREEGEESELTTSLRLPASLQDDSSHLIKLNDDENLSTIQTLANDDECVKGVSENVIMTTQAETNDPMRSQQLHLPNIKAYPAYDVFFNATTGIKDDVVIAIIDSGVELTHSDLRDNIWVNPGETAGNGVDDDANGLIDDVNGYNFASNIANPSPQTWSGSQAGGETHGTHVAGLSAARSNNNNGVTGVNGLKVKIMALNVFGATAGASTPNIDKAIRYAADKGAQVINMSLGGQGRAESTGNAIRYAVGKGVTVVVAAGNDNRDINTTFYTPASFGSEIDGMLTIGAIDSATNARCSFSNYNTTRVELGAPGCNGLYSTVIGNSYRALQGTSMASPVAAGAVTLAYGQYKSKNGRWPTAAEAETLMKTASRVESGLTSWFREGKTVDLMILATEIGGGVDNPPDDPPVDPCAP